MPICVLNQYLKRTFEPRQGSVITGPVRKFLLVFSVKQLSRHSAASAIPRWSTVRVPLGFRWRGGGRHFFGRRRGSLPCAFSAAVSAFIVSRDKKRTVMPLIGGINDRPGDKKFLEPLPRALLPLRGFLLADEDGASRK